MNETLEVLLLLDPFFLASLLYLFLLLHSSGLSTSEFDYHFVEKKRVQVDLVCSCLVDVLYLPRGDICRP